MWLEVGFFLETKRELVKKIGFEKECVTNVFRLDYSMANIICAASYRMISPIIPFRSGQS